MNKEELRLSVEDLILVSIPTQIKNFKNQAAATGEFKEVFLRHGAVWELAIISPDKTEFVLLREFEEKTVRLCNNYIPKNSCGEFEFKTINSKESLRLRFIKEDYEEKYGILFNDLIDRNNLYLFGQLSNCEREIREKQEEKKNEMHLQECRKKYLSLFDKKKELTKE